MVGDYYHILTSNIEDGHFHFSAFEENSNGLFWSHFKKDKMEIL